MTEKEPAQPLIQPSRLADQAYELLRHRILRSDLPIGARLSVPHLAREMNLSRSPVREAVQRLVAEGLCVERPNHGAVVAGITPEELADLYEIRAALEGVSASRAATRVTPAVLEELSEIQRRHRAAIDAQDDGAVIQADISFHATILKTADCPYLSRIVDPIFGRVTVAMLSGDLVSWPPSALREHQAIYDAIAANDEAAARDAAVRHIDQVKARLLDRLLGADGRQT